jgi:ArsR family transcriptional regulator, arsenate/arsenite/antimonite-responsive transcriptional repressor / arsenate reductase (thioredoxin)
MAALRYSAKPPMLIKALAHDLRWQIVIALARSDYRVQELAGILKQPENLVSYHLHRLLALDLVTQRRSSADGRDVYYSLGLEKLRQLYLAGGEALHPALGLGTEPPQRQAVSRKTRPARVLFLCTHNSARSQMAEGLARRYGQGRIEAFSAGSEPSELHHYAVRAMAGLGIDIGMQRPKHLDEFRGQSFDYIITVCDRIRESCPVFPGDPHQIHWSFADPAEVDEPARYRAFERVAVELLSRIRYLNLAIEREQEER